MHGRYVFVPAAEAAPLQRRRPASANHQSQRQKPAQPRAAAAFLPSKNGAPELLAGKENLPPPSPVGEDMTIGSPVGEEKKITPLARLRAVLKERHGSLEEAFAAVDFFPNEQIACVELEEFICGHLKCGLDRHEARQIFHSLDKNADGTVSLPELLFGMENVQNNKQSASADSEFYLDVRRPAGGAKGVALIRIPGCKRENTVGWLMRRIEEADKDMAMGRYFLSFGGRDLRDPKKSLWAYGIEQPASVILVPRRQPAGPGAPSAPLHVVWGQKVFEVPGWERGGRTVAWLVRELERRSGIPCEDQALYEEENGNSVEISRKAPLLALGLNPNAPLLRLRHRREEPPPKLEAAPEPKKPEKPLELTVSLPGGKRLVFPLAPAENGCRTVGDLRAKISEAESLPLADLNLHGPKGPLTEDLAPLDQVGLVAGSLVMVVLSHASARDRWAEIRDKIAREKKKKGGGGEKPEFMESLRGVEMEALGLKRLAEEPSGLPSRVPWSKHEALRTWLPSSRPSSAPLDGAHKGAAASRAGAGGPMMRSMPELQRLREALVQRFGSLHEAFHAADFFPSKQISCIELEEFVCSELRCGLNRHDVYRIFRALDGNGDGRVSRVELLGLDPSSRLGSGQEEEAEMEEEEELY